MSHRSDIPKSLIYTKLCGWVDKGHARPHAAQDLWERMQHEEREVEYKGFKGFAVYHEEGEIKFGIQDGVNCQYVVKKGLSRAEKESVALAIFLDANYGLENIQSNFFHRLVTDSGFSGEDLVSDLLGFYVALKGIHWETVCQPVSAKESFEVWDKYGSVGSHKNHSATVPQLYPSTSYKNPPAFTQLPLPFRSITPAQEGVLFKKNKECSYFVRRVR